MNNNNPTKTQISNKKINFLKLDDITRVHRISTELFQEIQIMVGADRENKDNKNKFKK